MWLGDALQGVLAGAAAVGAFALEHPGVEGEEGMRRVRSSLNDHGLRMQAD